jgi:hypothetical protein
VSKETCFVISPFGEPFDTYFSHIVKPAIEESDMLAVRGDSLYRPTSIMDDIWEGIRDARFLIAELTGRNPNVFYELGLAHALSKPVILISQSIEDVPFDLRSIRVLTYDKDHPDWGSRLKESLKRAINEVGANPTSSIPGTFKTAIKTDRPEENETAIRLDEIEAMLYRINDAIDLPQSFNYSTPFSTPAEANNYPGLEPGMRIRHSKFGLGEVLDVEGFGDERRARINFNQHGIKWLALHVAKFEILAT